jgi:cytidylate kinase
VGRGANVITADLPNTFHVRLVAPVENRVRRIQQYYNLDKKEAQEYVKKEDLSRHSFYLKNFHKNVDDPLLYHMTLNTGLLTYKETAEIIAGAVVNRFPSFFSSEAVKLEKIFETALKH